MSDWLSSRRDGVADMASNWLREIPVRGANWGIPQSDLTDLAALLATANAALAKVKAAERNAVDTADCRSAFDALKAKMRRIKERYFHKPPLTNADFAALGLDPPDRTPTVIPPPAGFAEADVSYPGVGTLELYCRPVAGQTPLDRRGDYGYRIYYGILPPGGAAVEQATGKERLLMKAPTEGAELPHSEWCRRQKERFYFPGRSGMTAYFCIRYENGKGAPGPWGPLFSAVIP